jgi:uncharacterized protein (DUF3820 family)
VAKEGTTIPFGQHKGKPLDEVPVRYLDWLIGQDWMDGKPTLKRAIEEHLKERPEWATLDHED